MMNGLALLASVRVESYGIDCRLISTIFRRFYGGNQLIIAQRHFLKCLREGIS